jgi:hypothetical protein
MPYIVRFDRATVSTGPDAVVIAAARYPEGYRDGHIEAYRFFNDDGEEVAMVRAAGVVYVARAGVVEEPESPEPPPAVLAAPRAANIGEE